jgi:hypothetical protein
MKPKKTDSLVTKLKAKKPRQSKNKPVSEGPQAIALQSLLLGRNELLLYKDEDGEYHVLCKDAYDPAKDYQVIFLTYKDIQD